jgi:uncharacterized membrane protein
MNTDIPTNTNTAKVIYILLIIGTMVGITGFIAIIMAYVMKDDTSSSLQTHYHFQIRTFWIGLLYIAIGSITYQIVIGYFVLLFTFVWVLVRCFKGLKQLANEQPVENLENWFFT